MRHPFLIACLVAVPFLGGACAVDKYATEEQRAAITASDARIAELEDAVRQALASVDAARKAVQDAARANDPVAFQAATQLAVDALDRFQVAETRLLDELEHAQGIDREIRESAVEKVWGLLAPFVPEPYQGPMSVLVMGLGAQLAFTRSRKHLGKAASAALRLHMAEAIKAAAKAMGWLHTEKPPEPTPSVPPTNAEASPSV